MKSSKDRAFFFSEDAPHAISCPANAVSGIEGGFVYYTWGRDKKMLYSFNVEDRSISIRRPCRNFQPSSRSFWFIPYLRTIDEKTHEVNQMISRREEEKQIETETRKGKHNDILKSSSEAEVRNICDLPSNFLALIAAGNLYFLDYMNFRLACKTFSVAAAHIQWRETSLKLQSHSLPPWLMFADRGNGRTLYTLIDPKLGVGGRYLMNIPESIIDFDIRYSKEGWLLMSSKVVGDSMFFYNPFIKKLISVPSKTNQIGPCHSFGFSCSPTSPGCTIVGISGRLLHWNDGEWHNEWLDDFYPYFTPTHGSPVFFEGAFYFLGQEGNLGVFSYEESDDGFRSDWKVLGKYTKRWNSFNHNYLLECEGNLFFAVFVDNSGESIGVFKLNKTTMGMAWRKVSDLGNYMLFVSPSSSFSLIANNLGMENKIYFPKFKGKEIVYYCLRTAKYRTFGTEQVAANFYDTTEYLYSAWIQQRWQ